MQTDISVIPQNGKAYAQFYTETPRCICVYKRLGFTPLQALSEIRTYLSTDDSARCTYAGRLDPMAEGWMYILWSGDADEKIALTSRGKVYEVEVLLGFSTDTGDILGLVNRVGRVANTEAVIIETIHSATSSFVGSFTYPYPKYSSPNIKQTLKAEDIRVKKQNGNIVSVHKISERQVGGQSLLSEIEGRLSLCQMDGDFRLTEISNSWIECLKENGDEFTILKLEITCSSGTYMRTLAEELGRKVGVASLAFSITRTKMIAR